MAATSLPVQTLLENSSNNNNNKLSAKQDNVLTVVESECNRVLAHVQKFVDQSWPAEPAAYCAGTWDGLACWPPTLPGQLASQPCQQYLEGHHNLIGCQSGSVATRYCTLAGKWFEHPETQAPWTNYSQCLPTPATAAAVMATAAASSSVDTESRLDDALTLNMIAPDELTAYAVSAAGAPTDALLHEMRTGYLNHIQVISIMSSIGYLTSLVLLCIALAILIAVRRLKSPRNKLLINLSASFMLRAVVIIFVRYLPIETWANAADLSNMFDIRATFISSSMNATSSSSSSSSSANAFSNIQLSVIYPQACIESDRVQPYISPLWSLCRFGEIVKHYSLLANYFWILMEGFYLNNILTFALFSEHSWLYAYICGGWIPPAIFVGIWALFKNTYANDECWHTEVYNDPHFWIIRGPITAAIFLSFVVFVNILRIVCTKLAGTREIDQSLQTPIKRRYAKLAKSFLCLIPLCGTHYVLTLTLADIKNSRTQVAWLFIEQLFTSFQGAFVALIYIFMSGDVRREIQRALTRRRSSKFSAGGVGVGNGSRKRSATAAANRRKQKQQQSAMQLQQQNGHHQCNHHYYVSTGQQQQQHHYQLRHVNSSPVGNGAVHYAAAVPQQPALGETAAGGTVALAPCPQCLAQQQQQRQQSFKLKPLHHYRRRRRPGIGGGDKEGGGAGGGKFHCFHPLLTKSLTLTTLIHNNNNNNPNGGADFAGEVPAAAASVAVPQQIMSRSNNNEILINNSNALATITNNPLDALVEAAVAQQQLVQFAAGIHHHSTTTTTRTTSNHRRRLPSERSGGSGGSGGTTTNNNATATTGVTGGGVSLLVSFDDAPSSSPPPVPPPSLSSPTVVGTDRHSSGTGNGAATLLTPTMYHHQHHPLDTDDGATDDTDDERIVTTITKKVVGEDEEDEESQIGERLMRNRHLYD